MAIAHTHSDTSGDIASPGATVTITKPTGSVSTDILILAFASGNGGATVGTYTAPSGWTAITTHASVGAGIAAVDIAGFWALGNVANLGFTKSGTVGDAGWVCAAFSGVDNTTPIDAAGTTSTASGANTVSANAVTVATANAWEVILACDFNDGTLTATGFTVSPNGNTNQLAAVLYNTTPKSTGSTGAVTVNDSAVTSNQRLAVMPFALRPAVTVTFIAPPTFMVPQSVAHAANW